MCHSQRRKINEKFYFTSQEMRPWVPIFYGGCNGTGEYFYQIIRETVSAIELDLVQHSNRLGYYKRIATHKNSCTRRNCSPFLKT